MKTLILRVTAASVIITVSNMLLPKSSVGSSARRYLLLMRTVLIMEPLIGLLFAKQL